jgi:hypothetical protein
MTTSLLSIARPNGYIESIRLYAKTPAAVLAVPDAPAKQGPYTYTELA